MLTALVVDDEAEARAEIADLLRLGGWQVREAADATEALQQTVFSDPDLVVTDMAMPGCSGTAMLHRLRRRGSRARFVVITQDSSAEVREESAAAGAEACLVKPVGPQVLMNFLHNRATGAVVQEQLAPITDDEDVILGSGTSSQLFSPGPWNTTARMAQLPLVDPLSPCATYFVRCKGHRPGCGGTEVRRKHPDLPMRT